MAGELSYSPATGQLVYSPATGQLALNCGGPAPCTDCTGTQDDALVTSNGGEASCAGGIGLYTYSVFGTWLATGCSWLWTRTVEGTTWYLGVYYDAGIWYAGISTSFPVWGCDESEYKICVITGNCAGGKVTFSGVLNNLVGCDNGVTVSNT